MAQGNIFHLLSHSRGIHLLIQQALILRGHAPGTAPSSADKTVNACCPLQRNLQSRERDKYMNTYFFIFYGISKNDLLKKLLSCLKSTACQIELVTTVFQ